MHLARLLDPAAELTVEDAQALRDGLRLWVLADGELPLERCLRLPPTPRKLRQAVRDAHLRAAAAALGAPTWQTADALRDRVEVFLGRRWPAWFDLAGPPVHADRVDAELWHAARAAGGALPTSTPTLFRLLRESAST